MDNFKASAQYDDWKGTAAADDADQNSMSRYLDAKGLKTANQFLIASSLWVSAQSVSITAYLFDKPDYDTVSAALDAITGPIPVHKVDVEVSLEEYFAFFKRFSVMHTKKGFNLEDREYDVI